MLMKKYAIPFIALSLLLGSLSTVPVSAQVIGKRPSVKFHRMPNNPELLQAKAQLLGLTVDELKTKISQGKTLEQIIKESGLTKEQLQAKMQGMLKTKLQNMVTSGKITQDQADQRLQFMADRAQNKMQHPLMRKHRRGLGRMDMRKGHGENWNKH